MAYMNISARSNQMTLSRFLALFIAVVGSGAFLQAQQPNSEPTRDTQPTFKEHRIGESAQEFFAIARMAEKNGMLSTEYCRSYLNDPKVKKAVEKAKKKGGDDLSLLVVVINVEGCNNVQAALAGKDVEVEVRFAAEFGSGSTQFIGGHLAAVRFVVKVPFNDVVEDMTAKLNANAQVDVDTFQDSVGAIVKQRRAIWTVPNMLVKIYELRSLEGGIIGTEVSVSNPAMMKHRTSSLN
jgi:hypothetical protein